MAFFLRRVVLLLASLILMRATSIPPLSHTLHPEPDAASRRTLSPRSCAANSNTSNGRSIAYYQVSNVRDRLCNAVYPRALKTAGLSHLYLAFAQFDPTTFKIVPADSDDVKLYSQFTALQSASLETWIAIGGYDFSNVGPTYHAWSDMTSTPKNRKAFISSLATFMSTHNFQGVDLDWENPGTRGGNTHDTHNLALLVKEMREAYGSKYGISLTLPPDPNYLAQFNVTAMEPHVDWYNFMAYDLAMYSKSNPAVGAQTDTRLFKDALTPLLSAISNPSKINLGTALYGRGYTLKNTSCATIGCPSTGPSKAGNCTDSPGLLSLPEISATIATKNLTPRFNKAATVMELRWGTQWIGYDDAYTLGLKKQYANAHCLGGTMVWSADFNNSVGALAEPKVTTDGTCGVKHGGVVCGKWVDGGCCSMYGYCGGGSAYCGTGCQSGGCT